MALRTVFFGHGEIAVNCLRAILADAAIENAAVFLHSTRQDSGMRANEELSRTADRHGCPLEILDDMGALRGRVARAAPDLLVSVGYLKKIPDDILSIPGLGAINLHGALLPKYRGRAPLCRALMNGESTVGVTVHYMTDEIDAGDIILQYRIRVVPQDDAATLFDRVKRISPDLLLHAVKMFEDGAPEGVPQDETSATRYGKITSDLCIIDWNEMATVVHNRIRALVRPYPGAFTFCCGVKYFVWKSAVVDEADCRFEPGLVRSRDAAGALVQTGKGLLRVSEAEPEGGAPGLPGWRPGEVLSSEPGREDDR